MASSSSAAKRIRGASSSHKIVGEIDGPATTKALWGLAEHSFSKGTPDGLGRGVACLEAVIAMKKHTRLQPEAELRTRVRLANILCRGSVTVDRAREHLEAAAICALELPDAMLDAKCLLYSASASIHEQLGQAALGRQVIQQGEEMATRGENLGWLLSLQMQRYRSLAAGGDFVAAEGCISAVEEVARAQSLAHVRLLCTMARVVQALRTPSEPLTLPPSALPAAPPPKEKGKKKRKASAMAASKLEPIDALLKDCQKQLPLCEGMEEDDVRMGDQAARAQLPALRSTFHCASLSRAICSADIEGCRQMLVLLADGSAVPPAGLSSAIFGATVHLLAAECERIAGPADSAHQHAIEGFAAMERWMFEAGLLKSTVVAVVGGAAGRAAGGAAGGAAAGGELDMDNVVVDLEKCMLHSLPPSVHMGMRLYLALGEAAFRSCMMQTDFCAAGQILARITKTLPQFPTIFSAPDLGSVDLLVAEYCMATATDDAPAQARLASARQRCAGECLQAAFFASALHALEAEDEATFHAMVTEGAKTAEGTVLSATGVAVRTYATALQEKIRGQIHPAKAKASEVFAMCQNSNARLMSHVLVLLAETYADLGEQDKPAQMLGISLDQALKLKDAKTSLHALRALAELHAKRSAPEQQAAELQVREKQAWIEQRIAASRVTWQHFYLTKNSENNN